MAQVLAIGARFRQSTRAVAAVGILLALAFPRDGAGAETAPQSKPQAAPPQRVLQVGPNHPYKLPSAAAKVARDGDLIRIDAGEYRDCAIWRARNLTIEGGEGYADVRDVSCDEKAIWVFYAGPVTIRNIRFSRSRVPNHNGAGIRWEGFSQLRVEKSWFHNNEMGILTHNDRKSSLVVLDSIFERNGDCETFCGHGVYAGLISNVVIRSSRFEGHKLGHHVKSRANYTQVLGNKIIDGDEGTASFSIDLPNSGTADIRHNFLEKGPKSENKACMICIGEEIKTPDMRNASRGILIDSNNFMNSATSGMTNFVWNRGLDRVVMRSNKFTGPGKEFVGP